MKNWFLFVSLIMVYTTTKGQIKGVVLEKETKSPLEDVQITTLETNLWAISNKKGVFALDITSFPVTLEFRLLGKKNVRLIVDKPTASLVVYLEENSLKMKEVVVTAKRNKKSNGSQITMGKQAIALVQGHSMADVMQLIPGKPLTESNLFERQILTLRTAIFNQSDSFNENSGLLSSINEHLSNNAFGITYLIDDIPLNNNSELSGNRGARFGIFSNLTENNSTGLGVDLKNISLNNIESIEVVQGISNAKYGDHNTGLVKIIRNVGKTPYEANATLRGGSYNLRVSKGYRINSGNGINWGLEYLRSENDPRSNISSFDRLNANMTWQIKKPNNYTNRLNFSYGQHINAYNSISSTITEREKKVESRRIAISNQYTKFFTNKWINQLNASISLNYTPNNTLNSLFTNNGGEPIFDSFKEGTFELEYTPVQYNAMERIDNKPLSFFSRLSVSKIIRRKNHSLSIEVGTSFEYDKNFGKGNYTQNNANLYNNPSSSGKSGYRNINFNDLVPADVKHSAYLSANYSSTLFNKPWKTDAGLRYDNYNTKHNISPRLNTSIYWTPWLKQRVGMGIFVKAPSLQSTIPIDVYYDILLADYRTNAYSFALGHTFIRSYHSPNLKPSKTFKLENGIDIYKPKWNLSLTAYYNKQTDGFTNQSNFSFGDLPEIKFTTYTDKAPDYTIVGTRPFLLRYSKPENGLITINKGIELLSRIHKIEAINTAFLFNATYSYTKTSTDLNTFVTSKDDTSEAYIGLHSPTDNVYQRLNSAVTFTHHIPSIGLVIDLKAEQFWMNKFNKDKQVALPFAYYDRSFNYFPIPENERADTKYAPIRRSENAGSSSDIPKPYSNYHLKVAKEFDNGLRLSFYAINFFNHLPVLRITNSDGEITFREANRPITFGGAINYKF